MHKSGSSPIGCEDFSIPGGITNGIRYRVPYRLWRFCAASERPRRHKTKLVTIICQLLIYIYIFVMYIYIYMLYIYIYVIYIYYTLQMIHTRCNTTTVHHGTSAFMATGHRGHWGGRGRRRRGGWGGRGQGLFTWGSSKWLGDFLMVLWLPSGKRLHNYGKIHHF